jgi:FkbM family methyltransferase
MCAFALNTSPLMTRYLVEERRAFAGDPLVIFDVGARWGMNEEWAVFGDQMRVYCFEPDEAECARLAARAPPQVSYIPTALGRASGEATLYESKLAASTSLYRTRMEYFGRLVNRDNGTVVAEHSVAVKSLDEAMAAHGVPHVDFIKLDAEGAELDILQGGEGAVRSPRLLGVLSEIRLHEEINGSPPFASLDAFLREREFRLYNIHVTRQSRAALPYPQLHDYRTPTGERFFAYTEHGQVQDGDALYFRDLFTAREPPPVSLLKLCALMEIYCLNDCAAELIVANRERLGPLADPDRLLDLLTSGVCPGQTRYRDYMAAYFSPTRASVPRTTGSDELNGSGDGSRPPGLMGRVARRFLRR